LLRYIIEDQRTSAGGSKEKARSPEGERAIGCQIGGTTLLKRARLVARRYSSVPDWWHDVTQACQIGGITLLTYIVVSVKEVSNERAVSDSIYPGWA